MLVAQTPVRNREVQYWHTQFCNRIGLQASGDEVINLSTVLAVTVSGHGIPWALPRV